MKKIIFFLSFIFLSCTFMFFGCENVEAVGEDCDYGVICYYNLTGKWVDYGNGNHASDGSLGIYFQCDDSNKNYNDCQSFISVAHASIHDTKEYKKITINNYEDIFYNTDSYSNYFNAWGKFQCPNVFYTGSEDKYNDSHKQWNTDLSYKKQDGYLRADTRSAECIPKGQEVNYDEFKKNVQAASSATMFENAIPDNYEKDNLSDEAIIQSIFDWGNSGDSTKYSSDGVDACNLINGEIRQILHDVFFFISVGGIIILVVMTSISLVKVITASEDDALRNFLKGLWKRIICLIILLVLPVLVTFIIQLVNNVALGLGINSDNPLCNVTE